MKKLFLLLCLTGLAVVAQEEEVQSGTPAVLEAINGKKLQAFLQRFEGGNVTFQPRKSTREMTVPASKVKSLKFFEKYDAVVVEAAFNKGDYAVVLEVLDPLMEPLAQYMSVENNLQPAFVMLMKSQYGQGDLAKARQSADILLESTNPALITQAQVYKALVAIAEGDIPAAQALREEVESDVAKLYLRANIERAEGQMEQAKKTAVDIIVQYGNDVDWLAPDELLTAKLYLDAGMTNSARSTAGMVKDMYVGTDISGDAGKLFMQLGGEEAATN